MDSEVAAIKREHFEVLRDSSAIMIVETLTGYQVWQWSPDGAAPASDYPNARGAAGRACQLLGLVQAVIPQSWPEVAQIGGDGSATPPLSS